MPVFIDEVITNLRAVDREAALSPDAMRQIIDACLRAVREMMSHEARVNEERSVDGPWALLPRGDR